VFSALAVRAAVVGQSAPAFTLKNTSGQARSLADYRGHVVLVNFWASWCAPCQTELLELSRLAAQRHGKGAKVVAINVDEDPAAGRRVLKRLKLERSKIEFLWDRRSRVVKAYDPPTMPSSFIIDRHGKIRFIHAGFQPGDPAAWRREIDRLSAKP
jgi:peroxiredoxin